MTRRPTAKAEALPQPTLYMRIYAAVRQIPAGRVASYGQIAKLIGAATPRQVGYAMAATPPRSGIPWHRVINSKGEISVRADGKPDARQKRLLRAEGVLFDRRGRVDWKRFGWEP